MAFLEDAHQLLGLGDVPPPAVKPAVPWRAPAQPYLTHDKIAALQQRLARYAAMDQLSPWERAKEFFSAFNPVPPGNGPPVPLGQPRALTPEQLADPLQRYREIARAMGGEIANLPEALASRDPRALGLVASLAPMLLGGAQPGTAGAEAGSVVPKGSTAVAREALPTLDWTYADAAHSVLGGAPDARPSLLAAPVERKLLGPGSTAPRPLLEPAVQGVDGKWYTGANHDMAWGKAAEALRQTPEGLDLMRKNGGSAIVRGSDNFFQTATGDIVGREQAANVAREAGATNLHPALTQLHSSDLKTSQFVKDAHAALGLPEPVASVPRIEPTPGALANRETQPFETQQLTKPLAEHSGDELNALQRKVEKARARAQVAIDQGAIGTTKPAEYDLQVLNDERARRAALGEPRRAPGETLTSSGVPTGVKRPTLMERPANADESLWTPFANARHDLELGHARLPEVTEANPQAGKFMAETYDRLVSEPNDPLVRQGYKTFIDETQKQYAELQKAGYTFDFVERDPYKNSAEMIADVRNNKHLSVFKTPEGAHPLLTPQENDVFRGVHDMMHALHGYQFGPKGEENAFRAHAYFYSPEAQRALATETRGQNSWVNFGPQAEGKAMKDRPYAQQKAALWPKGQLGDYPEVLGPGPLSRRTQPAPTVGQKVFHGTSAAENFGIPSIPSDVGVHVGTAGQAAERLSMLGSDVGPAGGVEDLRRGSRVLPLESRATNLAKVTRDLGNWHPNDLVSQLVSDGVLTTDEGIALLGQFSAPNEFEKNHALIRRALEAKGFHGIEYPNKFEASSWLRSKYGDEPLFENSQIIFDPAKHLTNPLVSSEGAAARAPLPQFPRVLGSEPVKGQRAPKFEQMPLPKGAPEWLGGPPPLSAPSQSLPKEDLRGLAMVAASDPNYINLPASDLLRQRFPNYAPYLQGATADKLQTLAKKFHAMTRNWSTPAQTRGLFDSPEGQAIRHWYEGWKGAVGDALPPDAAEMLTRFSAILSAQKSPKDEVGMALAALDKWAHGEAPITNDFMATMKSREKQLRLAAADQRWGVQANKTSGYYLARKGFKQTGALDRHVIRAYTGSEKVTPAQYEVLWHRVNADAERAGVPFDEFQAGVWGGQSGYKVGPGEPGAAPEDWLAYHLASGKFDRLIKKFPGLEALRAKGEQDVERQGMSGLLGEIPTDWRAGHSPEGDPYFMD